MNDKKIAFIYCYNDERLLKESILYIESLIIPEGYEIEILPVKDAESICSGYNYAMRRSNAKYKVYLHQDVFIINGNFILDILNIFLDDKSVGLIGMVGCKTLPTNAIWWEGNQKYGKVFDSHTGVMEELAFNASNNNYEIVQAVDGLIMITQYDIPWREKIFDGWHFYDISQSIEFFNRNYKVVVPIQKSPWCIHDCSFVEVENGFEHYRNIFLDEYSKTLFPMVSIIIPTYNRPKYLKEALESVLKQTYRNIEVIIGDDSTNDETERMIQSFLNGNQTIRYIKNVRTLGNGSGLENALNCLEYSKGEYINILADDDIFASDKISKMINFFLQFENISLVTSYRQVIDEEGLLLKPIKATQKLFNTDTFIEGVELGKYVLSNLLNVVGEPTTVLFRKSDLNGKFGEYQDRQYNPLSDVSTWLQLCSKGNAVYIAESLSYFRLHSGQNAHNEINVIKGAIEWYYLIRDSYENNVFVEDFLDLIRMITIWLEKNISILKQVHLSINEKRFIVDNETILHELYRCYEDSLEIIFSFIRVKDTSIMNSNPINIIGDKV